MTVITKPLSHENEKKEEKLEKHIVDISEKSCEEAENITTSAESRRICVEIAGHVRPKTRIAKSSSRILFVTKICLLIPALCSIILGFSIVMHGLLKIGPGRQIYRGYCRIPYPVSLIGDDLSVLDWKYRHATLGHDNGFRSPFGFASRLEDDARDKETAVSKKKYYWVDNQLVSGSFITEPRPEELSEKKKDKAIKRMMERFVQHFVAKGANRKNEQAQESKEADTMGETPKSTQSNDAQLTPQNLQATENFKESIEDRKEKVESQQEQLELDFDIDVEEDKEELQMPELSKGKYIHDFKMNKTAIIDHEKKRCFVFNLNRNDVASPRSLHEILRGMMKGMFDIDLHQIRKDMTITFPAVENFQEYGPAIKNACDGLTTYRLVSSTKPLTKVGELDKNTENASRLTRTKRSTNTKATLAQSNDKYLEFAGKYIEYNIENLQEIE
jgi:hypothetical protein